MSKAEDTLPSPSKVPPYPDATNGTAIYADQLGWCQGGQLIGSPSWQSQTSRVWDRICPLDAHPPRHTNLMPSTVSARCRERVSHSMFWFKKQGVQLEDGRGVPCNGSLPRMEDGLGLPGSNRSGGFVERWENRANWSAIVV